MGNQCLSLRVWYKGRVQEYNDTLLQADQQQALSWFRITICLSMYGITNFHDCNLFCYYHFGTSITLRSKVCDGLAKTDVMLKVDAPKNLAMKGLLHWFTIFQKFLYWESAHYLTGCQMSEDTSRVVNWRWDLLHWIWDPCRASLAQYNKSTWNRSIKGSQIWSSCWWEESIQSTPSQWLLWSALHLV